MLTQTQMDCGFTYCIDIRTVFYDFEFKVTSNNLEFFCNPMNTFRSNLVTMKTFQIEEEGEEREEGQEEQEGQGQGEEEQGTEDL